MKPQHFTTTILVDQSPVQVFNAINNVRGWWPGDITGETDKPQAEFTYTVPEKHYAKQKITEFIPGKKIVWHVLESALGFVKDKSEWQGTDIVFEIIPKDGKTEVQFSHLDLSPKFECYQACSKGWTMLINDNLSKLIATGETQPN